MEQRRRRTSFEDSAESMQQRRITVYNEPVFHIIMDNFLGSEINHEILSHIFSLWDYFKDATVGNENKVAKEVRSNLVCIMDHLIQSRDYIQGRTGWASERAYRAEHSPLLREVDNLFENKFIREIMASTPPPFHRFRHMNAWEVHVSRYGSGNQFYKWHIDTFGGNERLISLVYYLYKLPKKFRGGELCLTNGLAYNGTLAGNGDMTEIEAKNDRLVIFSSRAVHCVKPTRSPVDFEKGRFSVNIWAGMRKPIQFSSNNGYRF